MKKILTLIITVLMGVMLTSCDRGSSVNQKENPSNKKSEDARIIGGSVAIAEMLSKLDIKMIGRASTQYEISDKIKDLPEIGLPMSPDLEKIKTLTPDVYITSGALQEMIGDKLKESGMETIYANLDSYDSVKDTIKELSKKFGKEENGIKLVKEIEESERQILKEVDTNKKVKVMILFGAPGHFMLASENSFVGSLITKLGAENIASKIKFKGQYVPFSLETALKEDPDVILRMYHGYIDEAKKQVDDEFKNNPQWKNFKAIRENKVYDLDPKYFGVTGDIKQVESLKMMKDYLYK
ncbi:heme ABC transporter substrate-binding protein IsdE [Clostridium tetani]|uniref:heme ABC transporter substrate-binding protein IsdE n=1 Tax=Clostridium tetani TaxID=1513 RepID=UPI000512B275|nr:heme ABC transporter substrate-binding protein IsdE [Clostridium tetani]KGI42791.1 iron dicitrate ABC transporter substrate-binding protein [Clostridium tetani]KHO33278.1 iron dicitrate ABC transporter substrate-binding protein [Clostridium tetani]RXI63030.1 heme ABC transporter substrate-binding protein IsdE [Clostridium tetani]RXI63552.1 heme ABC transporter substrate-binding protein IsdE [Clostridium tetani]RXI66409.1 heme ABC transporter substrate-binding protein IsdE [Clostridium tetan